MAFGVAFSRCSRSLRPPRRPRRRAPSRGLPASAFSMPAAAGFSNTGLASALFTGALPSPGPPEGRTSPVTSSFAIRGGRAGLGGRGSRGSGGLASVCAGLCPLRGSLRSRLPPLSGRSPRPRRLPPPSGRSPRSGRPAGRGLLAAGLAAGGSSPPNELIQAKNLPTIESLAASAFIGAGCIGVTPFTTACARATFCSSCAAVNGISAVGFSTSL